MNALMQAANEAAPLWHQSIMRLGWQHFMLALLYMAAALLCLLNAHVPKQASHGRAGWHVAAGVLCLLAVETVLAGAQWFAAVCRALAHLHGWYGERRIVQYVALAFLLALIVRFAGLLHRRLAGSGMAARDLVLGLAALMLLNAMRHVSAHHTDLVSNLRLAGISVARLVELAALCMVVRGALVNLRLR